MNKTNMIAGVISALCIFSTPVVHASGIPTVDAATIAQLKAQLDTANNQLQNMVEQLNNAKAQLAAFTQSSGFGNVNINLKDQLRSALPSSAKEFMDQSSSGAINSQIEKISKDVLAPVNFKDDREKLSKDALKIEATAKTMTQRAYDSMTKRLGNIDALQEKINTTTNPKEIAELQARIQIEQANIQTEQTRIMLAQQNLEAERNLLQARANKVYSGWFGGEQQSSSN